MFSKLKASLQKAGKEVKGGFEKAGNSIKKGVEDANRSLTESRSHHSSPEKRDKPKSFTATTHDKKSEKAHSTNASGKRSEKAPTTTVAQGSQPSATRPSSIHSSGSPRDSLAGSATLSDAPNALRSPADTPIPPRLPTKTPSPPRSKKSSVESSPAVAPAAMPTPAEVPPKLSRGPSAESGNSLHFSEVADLEPPGSIQFTVEPGSHMKKSTPPKSVPSNRSNKMRIVEEVKENHDDGEKAADLTTEPSLDIEVVEDDTETKDGNAIEKEVKAEPAATKNGEKEERKTLVPQTGDASRNLTQEKEKVPASFKAASSRNSTPTLAASTKKDEAVVKDAKGIDSKPKSATGLHSRVAGRLSRDAREPTKTSASSRAGKGGQGVLRFTEDKCERSLKNKKGNVKKQPLHKSVFLRAGVGEKDDASDKGDTIHSVSFHRRHRSNSPSEERDEQADADVAREEGHQQRQHRGFRMSPVEDDEDDKSTRGSDEHAEGDVKEEQQKAKKSAGELRHSSGRTSSRDAPREKRRDLRPRDEGDRYSRRSTSTCMRDHPQPRAPRYRGEHNGHDEDRDHDHRRRGGGRETTSSVPFFSSQRRGSSRRAPLRALDGGAVVEECLRDTENYMRSSACRRHASPRSWRGDDGEGKPLRRRSAVQSTYQLDYPDWSRHSHERNAYNEDEDDDIIPVNGGHPSWRYARDRRFSPSCHRLSLYDEDDALAAEAVSEPERFRAHSAARCHNRNGRRHDGYGSGGEEAVPRRVGDSRSPSSVHSLTEEEECDRRSSISNRVWHVRQRVYSVAEQRPRECSGDNYNAAAQYGSRRNVSPLNSSRHRYDAPRPRSSPHTSSCPHRRSSVDRAENDSGAASWRRLSEDGADPDYFFSDAPRERQGSGSWNSHRRGSAFVPSPSRSPLWAHRSSFGRSALDVSPNVNRLHLARGAGPVVLSPLRGRRAGNVYRLNNTSATRDSSALRTSVSRPTSALSEEEILEEVEWKLDVLGQQITEEDHDRERAMMSSPFERLYHLNNRRDRDERRRKVFELNRLERIRDRIVSGSLEEDIARREERRRKQEEMLTNPNGVFLRLYQNTSGRRLKAGESTVNESSRYRTPHKSTTKAAGTITAGSSSPNATVLSRASSSRPSSATRRTLSREEHLAMFDRLYSGALATKNKKEKLIEQSKEERRKREVEALLIARLTAQLQLEHAHVHPRDKKPPMTPERLEQEARRKLDKMRKDDPDGYEKKLLRGRVLSEKEQTLMANRLWKHGYVSKEKLEARKAHDELRGCTFQPEVNDYCTEVNTTKEKREKKDNEEGSEEESHEQDASSEEVEEHLVPRKRGDRCKELYRKGMVAKAREIERRDERDRVARLKILRGRMENDHHFRRRVELDPSLAERFMKSLVV